MPKPDFEKLNPLTLEAYELFRAGKLTLARLDELESAAEAAAGDDYGDWHDSFDRYRDVLEAFAGRDPNDNS